MIRFSSRFLRGAVTAAVVTLAGAAALPAQAHAQAVRVDAVVETADAIFFQPSSFPSVVWFFPKSEIRLAPLSPPIPRANYWRTSVVLRDVDISNLAALRPDWAGKSPVPYIVRPATECQLLRQPEMLFVQMEYASLHRDISYGDVAPVCQFLFVLPQTVPAEVLTRLEGLRASGALIARDLRISLELPHRISWSVVHAAVAAVLADDGEGDDGGGDDDGGDDGGDIATVAAAADPTVGLTRDEAIAAIEAALATDALEEVEASVTAAERQTFLDQSFARLFVPAPTSGRFLLINTPPTGQLLYHLELIQRSL